MRRVTFFIAAIFATPGLAADEPRLQWTTENGSFRFTYRYDGKWALYQSELDPQIYKETKRTADTIELLGPEDWTATLKSDRSSVAPKNSEVVASRIGRWTQNFQPLDLGYLSEKYESSGKGPGTVSTGIGDPGGVSYGTYQLASKASQADKFVAKYYPKEFAGLKAGSPEFTAAWKALAAKDAKGLHEKEHEYIKATHFDPQVKKLKSDLGFDATKRNRVIQDAVWSTAVQHGGNTDVIVKAVKPLMEGKKIEDLIDEAFLQAVYAERGRKSVDGNKLARFPRVSDAWIPALTKRFEGELKDALEALK